jgi:hypothetical protein
MSSGDIEDVLSSIRRLVSEDLRPVSPKTPVSKEPVAQAKRAMPKHSTTGADGKLLLTPALRVVSDTFDAPEAPYTFVEDDRPSEPALLLRMTTSSDDSLASAQAGQEDWLPEDSAEFDATPGWAPEELPEDTTPDIARDMPDETRVEQSASQLSSDVTRVVNEIAAGVAAGDDEWESETGDAPAIAWQAPEWSDEAEVVEDSPLDASAAKAIADKAEAAAVAEILASAAGVGAGIASDSAAPDGEARFDEAVLRDLVRDLIHQELSGPLGERITRNVRKLVRTEINRARTTSALD